MMRSHRLPFLFGIGQTVGMLTISPPPELEEQLRIEAQKRGIAPEQLLLQTWVEKNSFPTSQSEEADEIAALDELVGCLAEMPSITSEWRHGKEEEMAREEEDFLRTFRGRQIR